MYSAVKDAYEVNWMGYSDVVSAIDVWYTSLGFVVPFWSINIVLVIEAWCS